jgi:hypothetical protein
MPWQLFVLALQLGLGGGLLLGGFRRAIRSYNLKDGQIPIGIAMMLVGALLLATVDFTISLLAPQKTD